MTSIHTAKSIFFVALDAGYLFLYIFNWQIILGVSCWTSSGDLTVFHIGRLFLSEDKSDPPPPTASPEAEQISPEAEAGKEDEATPAGNDDDAAAAEAEMSSEQTSSGWVLVFGLSV